MKPTLNNVSEPEILVQNAQPGCLRDSQFLAHAAAWNKAGFIKQGL
jgi:hypothetical protein